MNSERELGERILELASFCRKEDETEALAYRDTIKKSKSKTPRGERSFSNPPIPPPRLLSKSPRAPPPDIGFLKNEEKEDSAESDSETLAFPLEIAEKHENLKLLDLANYVRNEEEREIYESRETLKRGKSKTPREAKSTGQSSFQVMPKRRPAKSPRPPRPNPNALDVDVYDEDQVTSFFAKLRFKMFFV